MRTVKDMQFLPQLKDFLRENGLIYTARKYVMKEAEVYVNNVGLCQRIPLGRISVDNLSKYVEHSGFETVEEWGKKLRYFVRGDDVPIYLYKVVLIKKSNKRPYGA